VAICRGDVLLWRMLRDYGHLPKSPSVLELGEANWAFDVDPQDCPEFAGVDWPSLKDEKYVAFAVAKLWYKTLLDYSRIVSVDFSGTPDALKRDLNRPLPIEETFDIVVNSGTIEHCFDQLQCFVTAHERTRPGGLMIHACPISGWKDHSLFLHTPLLYRCLAEANGYEVVACVLSNFTTGWVEPIQLAGVDVTAPRCFGGDLMIHVALRKTSDARFCVPYQGIRQ